MGVLTRQMDRFIDRLLGLRIDYQVEELELINLNSRIENFWGDRFI